MPCATCTLWSPPELAGEAPRRRRAKAKVGRCGWDGHPSHPAYHCPRYRSRLITPQYLGLTDAEIAFCRAHPRHSTVRPLLDTYREIRSVPGDYRALARFRDQLSAWRNDLRANGIALRLPITER